MERINLQLFWTGMLACAVTIITIIWLEDTIPEFVFKIAGTCFVFGLANFLLWLPQVVYRFLASHRTNP